MRHLIYAIHRTDRFDEMCEFYERGVGLPVRHAEPGWVEFDTAGASLAIQAVDDPARQGIVPRFAVQDLDATLDELAARGAEPAFGVTDSPRGRVADLWDADGNLVSLLQPATPVPSGAGPVMTAVILNVADVAAATALYRDTFGLHALVESPWWTEFDTGATRLSLHPQTRAAGELRHNEQTVVVGLAVQSLEDLGAELRERGLDFSAGPVQERHGLFAEIEDPDGNVLLFRESGPHHATAAADLDTIAGDAPTHSAMRKPGTQRAHSVSHLVVKPAYKPKKQRASAPPAKPAAKKRSAPSVRGEGPLGTRKKPLRSRDPERVKLLPATGHQKRAAAKSLERKKRAVAVASRSKPVKKAAAKASARTAKRGGSARRAAAKPRSGKR